MSLLYSGKTGGTFCHARLDPQFRVDIASLRPKGCLVLQPRHDPDSVCQIQTRSVFVSAVDLKSFPVTCFSNRGVPQAGANFSKMTYRMRQPERLSAATEEGYGFFIEASGGRKIAVAAAPDGSWKSAAASVRGVNPKRSGCGLSSSHSPSGLTRTSRPTRAG